MLADLWPQYGLTIVTPHLRLQREEKLAELADLAGQGVHRPGERPFLTPWTDGTYTDRARFVLQEHWDWLASWDVAAWRLRMGVFRAGQPIGVVTLRARDFPVVRQVTTSAWLGMEHQGRGYGTEARGRTAHPCFRSSRRHRRTDRGVPGQPLISRRLAQTRLRARRDFRRCARR
jgi:RimJ/RimL family protein N-acetyltransferase